MIVLEILAWVLGLFGIAGTLIPFLRYDDWWIRDFDYPRVQLGFILLAAICLLLANTILWDTSHWVLLGASAAALIYQIAKILPYTPIWNNQVKGIEEGDNDACYFVSLLMSNVLQKNNHYEKLLQLIDEKDPDMVLTLETNQSWQNELDPVLMEKYPYTIKVPKENRYGMHLYSKLELRNETVNHFVEDDQPSIYTEVNIGEDTWIKLYGVHPSVPSPTEEYSSTARDGELAIVGKKIEEGDGKQTIVAGDLNDVAWSHSTRLFQRVSGLLDPRRGRGFFATYHAEYWFARWPLDHVFHSPDFRLNKLERLGYIGSDHFPVYVSLGYKPDGVEDQQALQKEDGDDETADKAATLAKAGKEDTVVEQD